jgi:hypothetical protein
MVLFFPNMTMQRYSYMQTGEPGVYGELVCEYVYQGDVTVDFQNENNSELAKQYGVERQNLYKVYTDISTTLNDNDVLVDEDGNQYQIIGAVQTFNHFHKHKRAHLIHARGDLLCQ